MIRMKKYVDPVGGVSYHLSRGDRRFVLRFTVFQYRDYRESIAHSLRRAKTQLKGVTAGQELSKGEHK